MSDVRTLIDESRITGVQIGVLLICLIMNMLDGMDVMIISYSAPSLSEEWGISPGALGVVFSAALFGMALGAALLAPFADIIGRRNMVMLCIIAMGSGVFLTAYTEAIWQLGVLRFLTGLGIGAMLASTATLASEYAPNRQKNLLVSIVLSGYPIGATLSGLIAAQVIPAFGWRSMFQIAGLMTLVTLPFAYFFLRESWDWLIKKQPTGALDKLNFILGKMGHPTLSTLPELTKEAKKNPIGALFSDGRASMTIQLWIAFFLAFATLYFLTAWIPNLASGTGLSLSLAIYAGTVFNLGAVFGIWLQGYLSQIVGLRPAVMGFFIFTAILMGVFGLVSGDYLILIAFALIGFGVQGGFIGMYSMSARLYPTEIRSSGIGGAIGAGRTGAIVSPIIGGWLVGMGFSIEASFIFFAMPLLIVCVSIWLLRAKELDIPPK